MRVQRLLQLLSQLEHQLTARLAVVLADEGCSVDCWRALTLLADRSGRPMSEIARHVMLPSPSLTRLIDEMVADNLVHRRVDRDDRRRVLVQITPRGLALHRRLAGRIESEHDRIFADCDQADLSALGDAVGDILHSRPAVPRGSTSRSLHPGR